MMKTIRLSSQWQNRRHHKGGVPGETPRPNLDSLGPRRGEDSEKDRSGRSAPPQRSRGSGGSNGRMSTPIGGLGAVCPEDRPAHLGLARYIRTFLVCRELWCPNSGLHHSGGLPLPGLAASAFVCPDHEPPPGVPRRGLVFCTGPSRKAQGEPLSGAPFLLNH